MSIFLVLSYTFGYLEQKLLGRLWKSLVFLKSNIYASDLSFNAIHSVIKKMFHKGLVAANGWHILFFDIFQRNLAHLYIGMEKY
jgi:hypothetical protein